MRQLRDVDRKSHDCLAIGSCRGLTNSFDDGPFFQLEDSRVANFLLSLNSEIVRLLECSSLFAYTESVKSL